MTTRPPVPGNDAPSRMAVVAEECPVSMATSIGHSTCLPVWVNNKHWRGHGSIPMWSECIDAHVVTHIGPAPCKGFTRSGAHPRWVWPCNKLSRVILQINDHVPIVTTTTTAVVRCGNSATLFILPHRLCPVCVL